LRVFETVELRGILKIEREGTMEGWRKLPNEELHNLHSSQNIISMTKARNVRRTKYVAHIREEKCIQNFSRET